ncbi:sensor histidine kinase [Aliidiomarina celeris]|uniref:sensor histidine kinase n=1 Tax=Aliidiomarina celeris TaxID=2249428 RepID=UPI000DE97DD7|nr:sensor histidine kinase [Aliidiomarina celeris]
MLNARSRSSIQYGLLVTVVFVTLLALSLSFAITTYTQVQTYKQSLEARTVANADILVRVLRDAVARNDLSYAEDVMRGLEGSGFITHLHLYRFEPVTNKLQFFTSFNRPDLSPIPARTNRLEALQEPLVAPDSIELSRPIRGSNQELIGYVYLRTSLLELNEYKWRSIFVACAITLFSALIAAFIANAMRKRLLAPLTRMNNDLENIVQKKQYEQRVPPIELRELNQVSVSINAILERYDRLQKNQQSSEQEHKALVSELENKISQRTRALREANNELISTLEQLHAGQHRRIETERLASMTDMVAGIAHEINTPLGLSVTSASIVAERVELLQQHKASFPDPSFATVIDDLNTNINVVQRNLAKASELIGSFRSLAFEHANESPCAVNLMDLRALIQTQLQPLLDSNPSLSLTINAPDTIVYVRPRPLETILTELIENAAHHAFKGRAEGHIQVTLNITEENLNICCKDNGVGMTDEMQHRIFEPFMTSSRISGHPGLGMHLVYNLVTQVLKGNILCESELGNGTQIRVTIPLAQKTNF